MKCCSHTEVLAHFGTDPSRYYLLLMVKMSWSTMAQASTRHCLTGRWQLHWPHFGTGNYLGFYWTASHLSNTARDASLLWKYLHRATMPLASYKMGRLYRPTMVLPSCLLLTRKSTLACTGPQMALASYYWKKIKKNPTQGTGPLWHGPWQALGCLELHQTQIT
jgi:hypothetical protein